MTRRPGQAFDGHLTTTYDSEDDEGFAVESAVDVPFSDAFKGRFAIRFEDREGYVQNLGTGRNNQEKDDVTARGSLLFMNLRSAPAVSSPERPDRAADGRARPWPGASGA